MRVLFINPAIRKETQPPLVSSMVFSSPPLGLGYIAAHLRQKHKDIEIRIIDEAVTPLSDSRLNDELNNSGSNAIVGISCLTATYARALELARRIKSVRGALTVVFGGAHPTALPDESLNTGVVDIVVRNEGEETMLELYELLSNRNSLDRVKGISYLKDGCIRHNPNREMLKLSTLPKFPYDFFEKNINHYSDFGFMLSSRGCPFDCIFCSNRLVTGRAYRVFPIEYVVEQIKTLVKRYEQRSIFFGDDNILADRRRFFNLIEAIMDKQLHKQAFFNVQVRGDDLTEDVLVQMKKANFKMVACGVETGSERLLDLLNKKESVEETKRAIVRAKSKGLLTCATFMFGLPSETRAERLATAHLARALPLDSARFNIAVPYPGTRLFEIAKKEGNLYVAPEWRNFNVQYYAFGDDLPYVPSSTGRYTLIFDTMLANLRFYLRSKILLTTFFKTNITGGNVISFQKRKSGFGFYAKLFTLTLVIFKRFIVVSVKALVERLRADSS